MEPLTIKSILTKFAKENPGSAFLYIISLVLVPIQDVLLPHLYGRVVNAIQSKSPMVRPFLYVIVVIALLQLGVLIAEWNEIYHSYPALQGQLRKDIMMHIFKTHETNYDEQATASLIAKMVKVPNIIYNLVEQYKIILIPQTIVSIAIVGYFLYNDLLLGAGIALAILIVIVFVNLSPHMCIEHSAQRERIMNVIYEKIDDVLRNMMSVFNNNMLGEEDDRLDSLHDIYRSESWSTLRCIMGNKLGLIPVIIMAFGFFMWRCYHLVKRKQLTTGAFVSLFLIMLSLLGGLNRYVNQTKELILRKGIIDAFLAGQTSDDMDLQTEVCDAEGKIASPAIHIENLTYMYPKTSAIALNNISLTIKRGEKVLIRGKIGCGKSTLLKLLMKYKTIRPTDTVSKLCLNGVPYTHLTANQIRSQIGYIPQSPVLFNRTLYENITYGLPAGHVSKQDIGDLIKRVGIQFPEGLDSFVGKGGSKLSGGQRQIVWILRVMLQNPPILLMDEPTASIDPQTKQTVHNLIHQVMEHRTVLMVAHDEQNLKAFDRVITMESGRIVYGQ